MAAPVSPGAAVVVAVSGRRSRRALAWAAEELIPHASRVVLLHVIPPVSPFLSSSPTSSPTAPPPLFSTLTSYLSLNSADNSGSSSARESFADEDHAGEIVEAPLRELSLDRRARKLEGLEPYRRLCNTDKEVEMEVLEEEDVANAILGYVARCEVKNLVLGCASFVWLNRMVKGRDVPGTVLNAAPATCTIFLVSRRKLVWRLASDSITNGYCPTLHIQRVTSSLLHGEVGSQNPRCTSLPVALSQNYHRPLHHVRSDSIVSNNGEPFDASLREPELALGMTLLGERQHDHNQVTPTNNRSEIQRSQTHTLVFAENNSSLTHTAEDGQDELEQLRARLQKTFLLYDRAIKELAIQRRENDLISSECSVVEMNLRLAWEGQRLAREIVEEEKAKHSEAVKDLEVAKQLLVQEALERHITEINASKEYREKLKIMNVLFSSANICRSYSAYEIETATNNFSEALKIGEGGYSNVYKCYLDQIPVAVKVLRKDKLEMDQFVKEVEVLTQLRHPHVVLLLGVCAESGCLIYEYMENGSLEDRLFKNGLEPLGWATRFQILYEVACTLAFLHGSKPEPVIHCDLKPGNILLDRNCVSKIADVGLARLLSDVAPDDITVYGEDSQIVGTPCYLDPEYQRTGTLRPKSDLYAFGLIALQILTKQDAFGIIPKVENALNDETFPTILDDSVTGWPLEESEKLARLALKCAALRCRDRPDLGSEVIPELEKILDSLEMRSLQKPIDIHIPSQYYCPILQEVMDDPYIAMDGFTYERRAIEAWLAKHSFSPVTRLKLSSTCILPNLAMRTAIRECKSRMELSAS